MITVMMATYNGENTLPIVLEAYRSLGMPDGGWCLIVIDNGSNDSTSQILDRYESLLPMKRLFVEEPGKNNALNAGLFLREGDLTVFTDDDAIPAADWLQQIRIAVDANPGYDIFGGTIKPRWECQPEKWILDLVPKGITFALTEQDMCDGPVSATTAWGPNMAIRNRIFDEGYTFSGHIGPSHSGKYAMGSETDFTRRLEKNGYKAWFISSAVVEHMIRSYQLERSWILARAIKYGRCLYHRDKLNAVKTPKIMFGVPRYMLRRLLAGPFKIVSNKLKCNSEEAFKESWELSSNWGYVHECWKASRR
jgi:glycosyltransferase involved in cell wall biosynthesis